MMDLRRVGRLDGAEAEACVVDGVASLPARAEVMAILTWEDNTADIDLRVTEPLLESISYDHPRTVAGGLLYYDVRDGYGPEIYASPIRAKGKFVFQVVYYAGEPKDVKARLTLIQSPGTPHERRTVHDVILPAAKSAVDVSLTAD